MSASEDGTASRSLPSGPRGSFPDTRWSMVVRAAGTDEAVAIKALGELLQLYWKPLYVFARRSGLSPADAEDGVQGFCESLIRRNSLNTADPGAGKFRSFQLGGMQNHLREIFRDRTRRKRGGRAVFISLAAAEAALETAGADNETPDKAFERRWVYTLLEQVLGQLRVSYEERGRAELFAALAPALAWNGSAVSYEDLGARLSMRAAAVQQAVKRMRQRYRKLLESAIGDTVDSPEAMAEERAHLIRILSET